MAMTTHDQRPESAAAETERETVEGTGSKAPSDERPIDVQHGDEHPRNERKRRLAVGLTITICIGDQEFRLTPVTPAEEAPVASSAKRHGLAGETRDPRHMQTARKRVRDARLRAGMSQSELARRLGISTATVGNAESGHGRFGGRYERAVLEACGVAERDVAHHAGRSEAGARGEDEGDLPDNWTRNSRYCAGIDPETFKPVRRGSARDLELRETYPRWNDWAMVDVYG